MRASYQASVTPASHHRQPVTRQNVERGVPGQPVSLPLAGRCGRPLQTGQVRDKARMTLAYLIPYSAELD